MPSGTNRLVNSENTKKGGSEAELTAKLMNANEVAAKIQGEKKGVMKSATKSVIK